MSETTRFAPSPTGPLHLGHALAALLAADLAGPGGTFLLRIEDIDRVRAKPHWVAAIEDDLRWLGLSWPEPVMHQSERLPAYAAALDRLWAERLLYPCTCTRRDIEAALSAPQEGVSLAEGPDGPVYPGTCRHHARTGPRPDGVLRLDMARALEALGLAPMPSGTGLAGVARHSSEAALRGQSASSRTGAASAAPDPVEPALAFDETGAGPRRETGCIALSPAHLVTEVGDVVLCRRAMGTSYHLSVVVDDAAQGVTLVTRGQDLFAATAIHVVLQRLLGLPVPRYHHHRLVRDAAGRRLAKRDDARALATYRAGGLAPADIRRMVGA